MPRLSDETKCTEVISQLLYSVQLVVPDAVFCMPHSTELRWMHFHDNREHNIVLGMDFMRITRFVHPPATKSVSKLVLKLNFMNTLLPHAQRVSGECKLHVLHSSYRWSHNDLYWIQWKTKLNRVSVQWNVKLINFHWEVKSLWTNFSVGSKFWWSIIIIQMEDWWQYLLKCQDSINAIQLAHSDEVTISFTFIRPIIMEIEIICWINFDVNFGSSYPIETWKTKIIIFVWSSLWLALCSICALCIQLEYTILFQFINQSLPTMAKNHFQNMNFDADVC